MVYKFSLFGLGALVCVLGSLLPLDSGKPVDTLSNCLGFTSEYVNVFLKNGSHKPIKLYRPTVKPFHGKNYLVGHSGATNHDRSFMFSLDEITRMSFPNPDYSAPKPDKPEMEPPKESLSDQVYVLRDQYRKKLAVLNKAKSIISNKNKQVARLKFDLTESEDEEFAKLWQEAWDLKTEEISLHQKRMKELEKEVFRSEIKLMEKKQEAILAGEYNERMDR